MLRNIAIKDFKENVFNLISKETMLITAGKKENFNTMTAAWGFLGEMWGNECAAAVVRPQRYTMDFINENDYFTLCFLGTDEQAKKIYSLCGSVSGRDVNKAKKAELTVMGNEKCVFFGEARLIIVCKKQYSAPLDENGFCDKELISRFYPDNDLHNLVIGKIERIYVKEPDSQ